MAANGGVFALMALERQGEALKLAEAVSKRATRPEAKIILANLLRGVGKIDEAETAFRAILETSPDNHSALFGMGLTAVHTDLDLAECYANRLEILAPSGFQIARLRLCILAKRTPAELPSAAEGFLQRFDGHPDAKPIAVSLLAANNLPREALRLLDEDAKRPFHEVDPRVLRLLMQAALGIKRLPVAARAGRELCRREAPHVVDLFGFGMASYRLGDWRTAKDAFNRCLEKAPEHVAASLFLYRSCVRSHDHKNIHVASRRLAVLKPDEQGPHRFLFYFAIRNLRFGEAFRHWRMVRRLARKRAAG